MESFSFYFGAFVVLCIGIIFLLIISPKKDNFYDLKELYPIIYYNIHKNTHNNAAIIQEILSTFNVRRPDLPPISGEPSKEKNKLIQEIDEPTKGDVKRIPLFYNNQRFDENIKYFPFLMQLLQNQPGITAVYFWSFGPDSAILQHKPSVHSKTLRYTLAVNSLAYTENDCSLWVDGEIKIMPFDTFVLWNMNKEYSLHNSAPMEDHMIFLNIEIEV